MDKVLAVKMPAPRTYTGQDVVEISCHGSRVILAALLDACVAAGARLAGPGEFTRRAFLAGKMDLAQAEAVCELIHASSERGARLAAEQLSGTLSAEIGALMAELADVRSEVEASIDFPEEGIEVSDGAFATRAARLQERARRLAATYASGRMMKDGVRVAIVGRPNAGKSSVMNRLAGIERSIVHHEPGTTRDVVEESVVLAGVLFRLRDTAGVRSAPGEVERLGIRRTREEIERADVVLALFDGSTPFGAADEEVLASVKGARAVVAVNKVDLPQRLDASRFQDRVRVSAHTGEGMDELCRALIKASFGSAAAGEAADAVTVTSMRHKEALLAACAALEAAAAAHGRAEPVECVAQHLRNAHEHLAGITGEGATEAMLDRIFSRFCIGK